MEKRGAAINDRFMTHGRMNPMRLPEVEISRLIPPGGQSPARLVIFAAALALAAPVAGAQAVDARDAGPWRAHAALDLPDTIRIDGSIRARYEALANPFVAGRTDDDEMLGLQTLVRAEFDAGSGTNLTFGGELLDSRFLTGNETGGAAAEINTLEAAQAYIAWRPRDFLLAGAKLDLTGGRFTMDVGSRRLIARANYRSILASFDGVRAVWTTKDKLALTVSYTAPVTRAPSDAASALDNEVTLDAQFDTVRLAVAHLDTPLPAGLRGELYVIGFDENDSTDAATRNRDLTTFGARLRHLPADGQVDFDLEYARQAGSQHATTSPLDVTPLDHEATMAHAEIGFSFDAPWSPRVAVQYDFASGDASSSDNQSQRFDPLFGDRSFEFGPTSLFGFISRNNLSSPGIRLEVKPDANSDALLMLRQVHLDHAQDSFANSSVRDATGASGKDVGLQLEGRYRHWLVKDSLRFSIGAAMVFEGDFLKIAPNATGMGDPVYAFSELTWTF